MSVSPSSGTLSAGQSTSVQVLVTNPNVAGTRAATLTVSASGAQNSPQLVTVTVNTTEPVDPNEPTDSPQQATLLPPPAQGESVSIIANATPGDSGTLVNQMIVAPARGQLVGELNLGAGGPEIPSGDFYG